MVFATQKMELANTSLIKECQRNVNLPLELTASIKQEAKKNASKNEAYKDKVRSIKDTQLSLGIATARLWPKQKNTSGCSQAATMSPFHNGGKKH